MVQTITVNVDDFKNELMANGELIVGLVELILKHENGVPQEIRLAAATLGSNLGMHVVTEKQVVDTIVHAEKSYAKPQETNIYLEDEPTEFEEVWSIVHSGDVPEEDLPPPNTDPMPEGTTVDD
jgi:hypothetical protein